MLNSKHWNLLHRKTKNMCHIDKIAACLFALIFISPAAPAAEGDSRKSNELAWARSVAEDFLDAALAGQGEQAQQLMDSSLKEAFAKEGEHRLREWLNNSIAIHGYQQPEISSEAIAPDQDEALFKGTFSQATATVAIHHAGSKRQIIRQMASNVFSVP